MQKGSISHSLSLSLNKTTHFPIDVFPPECTHRETEEKKRRRRKTEPDSACRSPRGGRFLPPVIRTLPPTRSSQCWLLLQLEAGVAPRHLTRTADPGRRLSTELSRVATPKSRRRDEIHYRVIPSSFALEKTPKKTKMRK